MTQAVQHVCHAKTNHTSARVSDDTSSPSRVSDDTSSPAHVSDDTSGLAHVSNDIGKPIRLTCVTNQTPPRVAHSPPNSYK